MVATPDETTADSDEPAAEATETQPADELTASPEPTPERTTEPVPTPTETEPAESTTYVGYVDGGGASVAVIVTGDDAIAYVCDGSAVEAWLDGSAEGDELDLTGERGSLTGSFDELQATGEATADDQTWTFTIEAVDPPDGLYRFADTIAGGAEVVGGWIVLPDGSQVGAINVDGQTQQAPPLDAETGQVTVDGTVVVPERLG
jgi:serine/threonine-protein kinase